MLTLIYLRYLDRLNSFRIVNMALDAGVCLESRFLIEREDAEEIVTAWFGFRTLSGLLAR